MKVQSRLHKPRARFNSPVRRGRRRWQPRLERLEDRYVPASGIFVEDFSDDLNPSQPGFASAVFEHTSGSSTFFDNYGGYDVGDFSNSLPWVLVALNYPEAADALHVVSFDLEPGEFVDSASLRVNPLAGGQSVLVAFVGTLGNLVYHTPAVTAGGIIIPNQSVWNTVSANSTQIGEITAIHLAASTAVFDDLTIHVEAQADHQPPPDSDADGVPDEVEDAHPNTVLVDGVARGDGNKDGAPDSAQAHVASLPNAVDGRYVTLEAPEGTRLASVAARDSAPPWGVVLPVGAFDFAVQGFAAGGTVLVTMHLPPQTTIDRSYKLGATPNEPLAHWYQFPYNAETGTGAALIDDNGDQFTDRIVLHIVDGGAGDDDLRADGRIVDPFAPSLTRPGSGEIHGVVWHDVNANGIRDDMGNDGFFDEPAISFATVYLDLNHNGQRDASEPSTLSLSQGRYSFRNLPPGNYPVALDLQTEFAIDLPIPPGEGTAPPVVPSVWVETFPADYASSDRIPVGDGPVAIAAADFNLDGARDVAVVNANVRDVSMLFNRFDGTFDRELRRESLGTGSVMLIAAHLGLNGFPPELVVVNEGSNSITLPLRNQTIQVGDRPRSVAAGDLDGDGDVDLAVLNAGDETISLLLNDGNFISPTIVTIAAPERARSLLAADFNADGKLDLALAFMGTDGDAGGLSLLLGNGNGTFAAGTQVGFPGVGHFIEGQLAAGDLDEDGDLDLVVAGSRRGVFQDADGDMFVTQVPALLRAFNDGVGQFQTDSSDVNADFTSLTAADLSPAPGLELVLTREAGLQVLVDGQFTEYPVGPSPKGSVAFDADGDGDLDLLVANAGSDDISLLRNHGDGRFDFVLISAHHVLLEVGEVVAGQNFGAARLPEIRGIVWNDHNGNRMRGPQETLLAGWTVYVDVNLSGMLDSGDISALTDETGAYAIVGLTPGTYSVVVELQAGWGHSEPTNGRRLVTVGFSDVAEADFGSFERIGVIQGNAFDDLNDNGQRDSGEPGLSGWTVYLDPTENGIHDPIATTVTDAQGDYSFTGLAPGMQTVGLVPRPGWWPTTSGAVQTEYQLSRYAFTSDALVDLNGDGRLDIVGHDSTGVSVLINDAAAPGTFLPAASYPADVDASIAVDVNGDGRLDLVTTGFDSNSVWVLINAASPPGTFLPAANYPVGLRPAAPHAFDVNGDGRLDLVISNSDSDSFSVLINAATPQGTFLPAANYPIGFRPFPVDVNGDGRLDLVTNNFSFDDVSVLINAATPQGTFLPAVNYPVGEEASALLAVDVNGDGRLDLVTSNRNSDDVSVLINAATSPGTFLPAIDYAVGDDPAGLRAVDVNGDGRLDLVTSDFASDSISVLINAATPQGTFLPAANYPVGDAPVALLAVDVNGDGRLDLVTGDFDSDSISVLINAATPQGTYLPAANYPVGNGPSPPRAVDFNGDGWLDIVTGNTVSGISGNSPSGISVLLNHASAPGAFSVVSYPLDAAPGTSITPLFIVDLNGDGLPDPIVRTFDSFTLRGGLTVALATVSYQVSVRVVTNGTARVLDFGNQRDDDRDGLSDAVEDLAPNGGDGNADGTDDRLQDHVAALQYGPVGSYVTLVSAPGTQLVDVRTTTPPSAPPEGVELPAGLFAFAVTGVVPGSATTVELILEPPLEFNTYYKFGRAQPGDMPDWYEWTYQGPGTTGAEILSDRIILHFRDGQRGDDDLEANGVIVDPGGPALRVTPTVTQVILNDGSPQRSMINRLTVTFSDIVTLDPNAFVLRRVGAERIDFDLTTSVVDGRTVVQMLLDGPLPDGDYRLKVRGARVHSLGGLALDGNADGLAGGNHVNRFFSLLGDGDGDRDVDRLDWQHFGDAYKSILGESRFRSYFDFDGDGHIDQEDRRLLKRTHTD